ncbi:hypothetical protein A2Z53_01375 [Candidatus Giovannonibacteria bacterium RIFCSPHIGHO2_02_42_15]|uniref:Uncharacterized protein n=1 Tax=Candidatus Giovannonibacteria bacterium RIFCSPHIGHO2_02_42_15 TaxID=1798329 RepID=A0A1F5VNH3_9BACT|nr:MAG: hypothetical protein A2Z53_01375 [Candidatus Giovannonibacteria bacterium RIFCSPHIGHO2_02_42_15]
MARQKWGVWRPEAERISLRGKNSAAHERPKPRCPARLSAEPSRKISGARKIKNCKESFSARQCRFAARRWGGVIRFFQEFLIKQIQAVL